MIEIARDWSVRRQLIWLGDERGPDVHSMHSGGVLTVFATCHGWCLEYDKQDAWHQFSRGKLLRDGENYTGMYKRDKAHLTAVFRTLQPEHPEVLSLADMIIFEKMRRRWLEIHGGIYPKVNNAEWVKEFEP